MSAEIEALRRVAEVARRFLPACEASLLDGVTWRKCGEPATHSVGEDCQYMCASCAAEFTSLCPQPVHFGPDIVALREALARVPR